MVLKVLYLNVIINKRTDEDYGVKGVVFKLNELYYLNQELSDENKDWKSKCISLDDFNRILLSELDTAKEQGYEVSDAFEILMMKRVED